MEYSSQIAHCDTCRAGAGEPCRDEEGFSRRPHMNRQIRWLKLQFFGNREFVTGQEGPSAAELGAAERLVCHANREGECEWSECPQIRDDEPHGSGRSCPLPDCSNCFRKECDGIECFAAPAESVKRGSVPEMTPFTHAELTQMIVDLQYKLAHPNERIRTLEAENANLRTQLQERIDELGRCYELINYWAAAEREARAKALEEAATVAGTVYEEHLKGNPLCNVLTSPGSVLEAAQRLIRARALAAPSTETEQAGL